MRGEQQSPDQRWTAPDLQNRIALVSGASYGIGRGVAEVLGECGMTVYVTGRTTRATATPDRPWSIEETAELVSAAGGKGIPQRCDHRSDADLDRLVTQITEGPGRLDLLINNVWAWQDSLAESVPVWEEPLRRWDDMFGTGVRGHYITARAALPLLLRSEAALIVHTATGFAPPPPPPFEPVPVVGSLVYELASHTVDALAAALARRLRQHGVAVVSVHPGWPRTVNMMRITRAMDDAQRRTFIEQTESAHFAARGIAMLAADPQRLARSGRAFSSAQLAELYGFTDTDGRTSGGL